MFFISPIKTFLIGKSPDNIENGQKNTKQEVLNTIEKLNKDVSLLSNKLSNEKFVANADEDVVAADRILLKQSKEQVVSLTEALTRFQ